MITPSLSIAWSLAEIEASTAGFSLILPSHFWIGCGKGCDLDFAKFLVNARPEIKQLEGQIVRDFRVVRAALAKAKVKPSTLRRALRARLGKQGEPVPCPLRRSTELRVAFAAAKRLAEVASGVVQPIHVLYMLLEDSNPIFDECLTSIGGNRGALAKALEACVLAENFDPCDHKARDVPAGDVPQDNDRPKKKSILAQFGRDLNQLARNDKLPPLIGRKPEMLKIAQTLLQNRKNNVILVGEPGVGKTGIVEGLARRIVQGKVTKEPSPMLTAGNAASAMPSSS